MSEKKQTRSAAAQKGKSAYKNTALWIGQGRRNHSRLIVILAVIGIVAMLAGYVLDASSLLRSHEKETDAAGAIRISEFMSQNLSTLFNAGDVPDWIEIENVGSQPVNLHHFGLLLQSNINNIYSFPNMTLNPGAYALVYADGLGGEQSAPFKLNASGGETLVLLDGNGAVIDSVVTPELQADASYCRTGENSWSISNTATPGKANVLSDEANGGSAMGIAVHAGSVEISEAMSSNTLYFADESGNYHDYIEIHNTSGEKLNLEGWYLSDSADKIRRWAFPEVEIPAGGYLAVHCSGENRTENPNHLHTNFKLGKDGETIYLTMSDGRTVSMAEMPAMEDNQAYSLVNGKWTTDLAPTPGMVNDASAAAALSNQRNAVNTTGVYINEIMASPTQQNNDWIEIYNSTAQRVDISGWGLSDNAAKPRKYQFPQGTYIEPGQYMGVFFSGTKAEKISGFLNADFSLSMDGGYTVSLSTPEGGVLDSIYVPAQHAGNSYGRIDSKDGFYYFQNGTPGMANGPETYLGKVDAPEYSVRGGMFKSGDSFYVELSAPEGSQIYYTLDCSTPDWYATPYTAPISVTENTILRTIVYRDGYLPSYPDTQSYLYDVNHDGFAYVVSLVSDWDNLISDERGIMVKGPNAKPTYPYGAMNEGANFWMDWERDAHIEMFTADGELAFAQGCGIKLHGQYGRAAPVKSFKVIARSQYGGNRFEYPIFSHRDYPEYQSFLLRAAGQDYDKAFMRDSLLQTLMRDTSVMYQETEVAVCYINGQYYSLFYVRERINSHSICQFEGWDGMEDDIDLVKANSNVFQGSNGTWEEMLAWLKSNDVTTQAAYDYIDARIDIQNYIEYMAIQIFVGNGDTLNVKRYRNPLTDGKWRWVLFDLDWAFSVDTDSIRRWLDPKGMGQGMRTDTTLFTSCMKNPIFYDRFMTYFGQRMATVFTAENVVSMAEERYYLIDGLLPDYQKMWNLSAVDYKKDMKEFLGYVNERPRKLLTYFRDALKMSNEDMYKYFADWIAIVQNS